ncbi:unnamed protein product [Adineta ricciae]|uniref:Alpha-type protein kinase domain-containing protein n=1 Tax=Adineta ricciae TaxID=249248 RepID=A0A815QBJ3_ADIRI|nr:unnamed protein product [Adineta ricciae]CAF1472654.1 unnamed protein product [Adineta ricciae]
MDCTKSMKSHIDKAKEDIHLLTEMIPNLFKVQPCLAFVGYRDVNSSSPQCLKMDFTKNVDLFEQFLGNVQAVGGSDNDFCEDVFGGLEVIPTLLWTSANRILIHICDAPCHGRQYYDAKLQQRQGTKWDAFPDGDPKNRDIAKLLLDIKSLDIHYFSIQLKPRKTRKMFDEFRLIYGLISELDVANPSEMMNVVTKMASSIIMSSIENTMSIFRTTDERKVYTLSNQMPEWSTLAEQMVNIIEVIMPRQLDDIFQRLLIGTAEGAMKIAPGPFARGSLRYAYYGKFSADGSIAIDVVYKELINSNHRYNTMQVYKQHLEIHVIAQFLAEMFNAEQKRIFRHPREIIYAEANIVQQKNDPTKIFQVEARLHQKIQKWNNNSGGVSMEDYASTLQSFSHWTYQYTCGRLMVVDLQGVKTQDNGYLLTDPAIHFQNLNRYREARTNLGTKGMREFFRTHICTEVCEKLELDKVENNIDEETFKRFYISDDGELELVKTVTDDYD